MLASAVTSMAAAAPLDVRSDRTALTAYQLYVRALVASVPGGRGIDDAFVASINGACAQVLTPLRSMPASKVSQTALEAFGEEVGGDLAVEFHSEAAKAFARLSRVLTKLRWSSARTTRTVMGLVTAVQASLELSPSDLCADARALAANPLAVPAGTTQFLATYRPATALAKRRLTPFLGVLSRFQTPAERGTIASINRLVTQFDTTSSQLENKGSSRLVADLGLSG
jgi:hypothetical protein